MPGSKVLWFFMFFVLLTASLAAPTPNHRDSPLKYHPNSFAAVLGILAKDPDGALRLCPDGILRSFAANGSVIDSRNLSASRFHGFASDTMLRSRRANTHPSPTKTVPPPSIRLEGTGPSQIDPEILGECSPPLACHNSTSCGGGCGSYHAGENQLLGNAQIRHSLEAQSESEEMLQYRFVSQD